MRMTAAVAWMMEQLEFDTTVYVDDFIGVESSYLCAAKAFDNFIRLCELLGLDLARDKCFPPCVKLIWLGFYLNAVNMSISIPSDKLKKVLEECNAWLTRPRASRKALQSLVGYLNHISSCITPGRKFISRILREVLEVDVELR